MRSFLRVHNWANGDCDQGSPGKAASQQMVCTTSPTGLQPGAPPPDLWLLGPTKKALPGCPKQPSAGPHCLNTTVGNQIKAGKELEMPPELKRRPQLKFNGAGRGKANEQRKVLFYRRTFQLHIHQGQVSQVPSKIEMNRTKAAESLSL